ncbi:formate C-acetyltransferase/glycerol dehydratase family glycyl radical enzyme [Oceanispirochaeta sp.]|uniref:glycyl radical protein n=1 Tax=Oceanispirochaeta sp. TaxID=2035350 RepID=UPI00262C43FA|nr:formate C-acetyltransferase/glycerol dehydratase family glycyl radical enzyme [Oceanispirochaeta sp.]MDA3958556.1 formate C-acetyltransferase/glycerol dehydratase family glycyl radical enzyme [Oceanispirochaeta sp.]
MTDSYKEHEGESRRMNRAYALAKALEEIRIKIYPGELIVGNRTAEVRAGVVSPEAGISWIDDEIESLETRPQDKFRVRPEDIVTFREEILPYWKGRTLEDIIRARHGDEISAIGLVAKINQKDHPQGHICPDTEKWLRIGPAGLKKEVQSYLKDKSAELTVEQREFYEAEIIVLSAAQVFIRRYADLAEQLASEDQSRTLESLEIAASCRRLVEEAPENFRDALQSLWFLYVLLQMESNASSFSPGRADQYLYPYWKKDMESGGLNFDSSLELVEALWLKFNQIVYLRNSNSAKYFAGFPIGFNVALGGQSPDGRDSSNELSFLMLKAQDHLGLPQPNLSARLFKDSAQDFLEECSRVIGRGSGMPQIFNDESIIPALEAQGIKHEDAVNYAIVGCVELTTHGNALGWSDAAMFNLVKVLELTLNNGVCLLSGKQIGLPLGTLESYKSYEELETAYRKQMDHFVDRMMLMCDKVDRIHAEVVPSAFLSSVIEGCQESAQDVTAGGALYNLSGIQAIQVANLADSLAVIKKMVFEDKSISSSELLDALRNNYQNNEILRQRILNKIPKYGNDIDWVDEIGAFWVGFFAGRMKEFTNARGGHYHTGLYTVSAHIPMGHNVGASPDGRLAKDPLADGGVSAMYGRDVSGPTALLKSVSKINPEHSSNGSLLNMKFLPDFFKTETGILKFTQLLRTFVRLHINHVQFNVLRKEDLLAARAHPEQYKGLTVRVAGYTAYFVELAGDLQEEIIARTTYSDA